MKKKYFLKEVPFSYKYSLQTAAWQINFVKDN